MTREDLFRAVGEVREDQIEAAETVKKQIRPRRRFGMLAACLVVVLAVGVTAAELREADRWKAIVKSFQPSITVEEDPDNWNAIVQPFGPGSETADAGGSGDVDGTYYSTGGVTPTLRPSYSTGVEIGELSGPGDGSVMMSSSACLAWLEPEEIFDQDTVIFRGTVRDLQYYQVEMDTLGIENYYTRAIVEVTDTIRGDLIKGEIYALIYMGAKGYMSTSISGPLEELDVGSDAIFMPIRTDRDTGRKEGNGYFCYADLADFYLSEGMRYVFADTGEGLDFERSTYPELETAETLDEVAAYVREMTGETERTQPAAVPATPQTEPPETKQAAPEEADPSHFADGPRGAQEMPGGAFVSE